jgi:hypothetical protein
MNYTLIYIPIEAPGQKPNHRTLAASAARSRRRCRRQSGARHAAPGRVAVRTSVGQLAAVQPTGQRLTTPASLGGLAICWVGVN